MTTVAILPIFDADGEKTYRAIAGVKLSWQNCGASPRRVNYSVG
ncbi:MAG: hypothetical protein V7K86_01825 [Nostoc sp.]